MSSTWTAMEDEIAAQVREAFLEDSEDRLAALDEALECARQGAPPGDVVPFIRRQAHTLKGMGAPSGFATVSTIAHRLEDYLEKIRELSAKAVADVQRYLNPLSDIVARRQEPDAQSAAALRRRLRSSTIRGW
jgi:chemotaxis protein histidine kinase CheA